jgi:hypothetical protein
MAYDEQLAERVRSALRAQPGLTEQKMFGGLGFMLNGNMVAAVKGTDLMLRLSAEQTAAALQHAHARPLDPSGARMKSYVYVEAAGTRTDKALRAWLDMATALVLALPPKK